MANGPEGLPQTKDFEYPGRLRELRDEYPPALFYKGPSRAKKLLSDVSRAVFVTLPRDINTKFWTVLGGSVGGTILAEGITKGDPGEAIGALGFLGIVLAVTATAGRLFYQFDIDFGADKYVEA